MARHSLKSGDTFALLDECGEIPRGTQHGLYAGGTRFLSTLEILIDGKKPELVSTNADDVRLAATSRQGDVTVMRELVVDDGRLQLRLEITAAARTTIDVLFDSDFSDIFEIRGWKRAKRGTRRPAVLRGNEAAISYEGLDRVVRETAAVFDPSPKLSGDAPVRARFSVAAGETRVVEAIFEGTPAGAKLPHPRRAVRELAELTRAENARWDARVTTIRTSHDGLNRLIARASADLRMLVTPTAHGAVPYAGIPWYACPFGRDSIWTSLMALTLTPSIAAGTIPFLAAMQATAFDDFVDSEPGKIFHELRTGEMVNLREHAFIPYYGTVDATPLFVVLVDRYVRWSGQEEIARRFWPNVKAALGWITGPGDLDGDGFVEYRARSPVGLRNQGWKDSGNSIFHRDGEEASGAIALVEVQGYAFAALEAGARLASLAGEPAFAATLTARAQTLRASFENAFWSEERGFYAEALDGKKRRCEIVTSNPGHALWSGIVSPERARQVAAKLLDPSMSSGWGIRTLAAGETRYDPKSYHNGSIWPHDAAIAALGMRRYGLSDEAARVTTALLEAGNLFDDRIPELFGGFPRVEGSRPEALPVACVPQAWSAATIFALLQAMLGLTVDGAARSVTLERPALPAWLDWVEIDGLDAGPARARLRVERGGDGAISLVRAEGATVVLA